MFCSAIIALLTVATAMAQPVEQQLDERQISIPGISLGGTTVTLPALTIPGLGVPGATIPTVYTIPAISTNIPLPKVCPTAIGVSIPAATLTVPVSTISKVFTVTVTAKAPCTSVLLIPTASLITTLTLA